MVRASPHPYAGRSVQTKQSRYSPSEANLDHANRETGTPGKCTLTSQLPHASSAPVQRKAQPAGRHAADISAPFTRPSTLPALRPDLFSGAVQRRTGPQTADAVPASSGGGVAMPPDVQRKMEQAFGADFSAVRIHQGGQASAIGALAYTQGTDIHFAPGQYDPFSAKGQELLGHELTHVVQQAQGRVAATTQKKGVAINDDSSLEREADQLGAQAARGEPTQGGTGHRAISVGLASTSNVPVQRNKTTAETSIPVQTDGNCGLFSILTAMRAFGFSGDVQAKAKTALDTMTETSEETFLGEVFTVDLMVNIINELKIDGKPILKAAPVAFGSQEQLEELLAGYKGKDNVALLIGYSKPDEYDRYYKMRGKALHKGTTDDPSLGKALDDKVGVEDFKVKDAHWGMINQISDDGFLDIADNITNYGPDKDHGYNTLMSTRKLYNSNTSLSQGEFDWSGYLENDQVEYNTMNRPENKLKNDKDKTKDLTGNKRYEGIKQNGMKEKLDLSGRLVVVTVTEDGASLLGQH